MIVSHVASAWGIVAGMFAWEVYLYFHWSGVDSLPMQFGFSGHPTWYATRGPALFLLPIMSAALLGFITFARRGHVSSQGLVLTAALMFFVQAFWVFLARRYV